MFRSIASSANANAGETFYATGYADAETLLHTGGQLEETSKPVQRARARYIQCAELAEPTATERAYLAGFQDGAADNLAHPPADL